MKKAESTLPASAHDQAGGWQTGDHDHVTCHKTKTVKYECGCEIVLGDYTHRECELACLTHAKPISEIITVERITRRPRNSD